MKRIYWIIGLFWIGFAAIARAQSDKQPVSEFLYNTIQKEGVESAVAKYKELKMMESTQYDLSEAELNALGYKLLNEEKEMAALAIFELNAETHPESINVWDSLGEGYLETGAYDRAAENYRKTLDMIEADTSLTPRQKNFLKTNAETKLYEAEHFDPPAEKTLHYVSFHGGVPAGKWDMQNVSDFKSREGIKMSYEGNNLYFSPVPGTVEEMLTGENPADVTTSFVGGDYRRFIEKGEIADISSLWKQEGWDEVFQESFKRMATYDGKQYFIPMAYQWNPIFYRKDIFEKHNLMPPQSWKDLLDLCDRLNELGYAPFSIAVQNWPPPVNRWFTIFNLRLNGPEFHDKVMRGEISFMDDRVRNVFVHWRELFRHDAFVDSSWQNNYQNGVQDFVSGKTVMYNLGEWLFESPPIKQMEAKIDFFVFPEMNPNVTSAEIVHTYGAFMRAGSSHSKESRELLKWLASAESQQSNMETNNRTVANMKVDQSLYSGMQKRIIKQVNDTEVLVPLLEMNTRPGFAQKVMTVFQEFWKHPEDINSALEKLEEARQEEFMEN